MSASKRKGNYFSVCCLWLSQAALLNSTCSPILSIWCCLTSFIVTGCLSPQQSACWHKSTVCPMQVVVDVVEPGKLILYPHILLACIALLGVSYVHLWELLLDLLSKVSCMLACILNVSRLSWRCTSSSGLRVMSNCDSLGVTNNAVMIQLPNPWCTCLSAQTASTTSNVISLSRYRNGMGCLVLAEAKLEFIAQSFVWFCHMHMCHCMLPASFEADTTASAEQCNWHNVADQLAPQPVLRSSHHHSLQWHCLTARAWYALCSGKA